MENQTVQAKTGLKETTENIKTRINKIPRNTLVPIVLLLIITIVLLILALYNFNVNKPTSSDNTAPYAHTDLRIVRQSDFGDYGEAGVSINTGENTVTAVQLELSYDPKVLSNVDLRPGSFFTKPTVLLEKIDEENGKITYALGVGVGEKGVKGSGNVAVITFTEKSGATKTTYINFLPETVVTAEKTAPSVLRSATSALFSLEPTQVPSITPIKK